MWSSTSFSGSRSSSPCFECSRTGEPNPARFLVLGSASLDLVRGVSESLAGRVTFVEMSGFRLDEVGTDQLTRLWVRGGFPEAFLAEDDEASFVWRSNFMRSFLERDVPQVGIRIPSNTLRRFWLMLAHVHGQLWNAAELARSLMTKEDTARRYLDILTGTFMVRQLSPWFENIGKRLVKAPKVFIRDSGIFHALLGLRDPGQVQTHPRLGLSWEGFALDQVIQMAGAEQDACFYKTHGGAELDLLLIRGGKRYGFEFKYADAPRITKSMRVVIEDLGLERLFVIYPGENAYPLAEIIEVLPLHRARSRLQEEGIVSPARL